MLYVHSAALGGVLSTTVYNALYKINSSHPFPQPHSFDFSQVQRQPNQPRETFHGTRANKQRPSGAERRARDLGARVCHSDCCVLRSEPVGDAGPSRCRCPGHACAPGPTHEERVTHLRHVWAPTLRTSHPPGTLRCSLVRGLVTVSPEYEREVRLPTPLTPAGGSTQVPVSAGGQDPSLPGQP